VRGKHGFPGISLGLRSEFRSLLCSLERAEWLFSSSMGKKEELEIHRKGQI
jgi:hypothetical protein